MFERENKKSHRLRAIQENFEEGYVKKKVEMKENAYQF